MRLEFWSLVNQKIRRTDCSFRYNLCLWFRAITISPKGLDLSKFFHLSEIEDKDSGVEGKLLIMTLWPSLAKFYYFCKSVNKAWNYQCFDTMNIWMWLFWMTKPFKENKVPTTFCQPFKRLVCKCGLAQRNFKGFCLQLYKANKSTYKQNFCKNLKPVVDAIKLFFEEIWISPKLRNGKSLFFCLKLH